MEQTLNINIKLPNLNDWVNAMNRNRYAGHEMKKKNQQAIVWMIKAQKLQRVKRAVHIRYMWHEKTKRRDKDNVSAFGRKVINDALQERKILPDDNNEWIRSITEVWDYGQTQGVTVTITEL